MPKLAAPQRQQKRKLSTKKISKISKKSAAPKHAKRSFHATTAQKRLTVGWNKAMSPFDKQLDQSFIDMQGKLDNMWREVYSAPKEVSPINFADFDAKIKNKTALAQIKAEYEAKTFKVVKTDFQSKEAADALIKKAEAEAAFMNDMVCAMKNKIDAFKFASTVIPFMELDEEIALTPGLDEEFDRQLSNFMQVPDAATLKAMDYDAAKIIKEVESGVLPEIPAEGINKIMFTPVYFALLEQHQEFVDAVMDKYQIKVPNAETLINASLKKQNALPTLEQINEHLENMELPFALTAIEPAAPQDAFPEHF